MDDIKLAGKTENTEPTWKILMKDVDLESQHHLLIMYVWVALKESVKSVMRLWQLQRCQNPGFLLESKKNYLPELQGNLMQKQNLLGPMT